jgi:rSAM/selenodomain-associated transferase 2
MPGDGEVRESGDPAPRSNAFRLSVIVPALNEANRISGCLQGLAPLRARGAEVIVVDGGSTDGTPERAQPFCERVLRTARGRAQQMNAGAREATGTGLLFLHADTTLPPDADLLIEQALAARSLGWGHFDVALSGSHPLLRTVEAMMNWRSRITGIATGDQAMFMTRDAFEAAGAFPDIALMEDVRMSARLRTMSRPLCLGARVRASSRRWERDGIVSTILLMWRLRLAHFLGADPEKLAKRYYREV